MRFWNRGYRKPYYCRLVYSSTGAFPGLMVFQLAPFSPKTSHFSLPLHPNHTTAPGFPNIQPRQFPPPDQLPLLASAILESALLTSLCLTYPANLSIRTPCQAPLGMTEYSVMLPETVSNKRTFETWPLRSSASPSASVTRNAGQYFDCGIYSNMFITSYSFSSLFGLSACP